MHVRVRFAGKPETIVVVESKLSKIDKFRRLIKEKFDVDPEQQRLFYGGKVLENGYSFHDYNIKLNDVIQLMVRNLPSVSEGQNKDEKKDEKATVYEDAKSNLYAVGDLIDMRDSEQGAWFEGTIVRIVHDPKCKKPKQILTNGNALSPKKNMNTSPEKKALNKTPSKGDNSPNTSTSSPKTPNKKKGITDYFNKTPKSSKKKVVENGNADQSEQDLSTDVGLLYKILLIYDDESKETDHYCTLNEIRPRARTEIPVEDLKNGTKVMISHNTEEPLEKGYWYDFTVHEINKLRKSYELVGTLYLGPEAVPQNDTKVRVLDKIYAIEEVVPIRLRSKEYQKLMTTPTETRSLPLNCTSCRDDESAPCKECGCYLCSGKEQPEKIILCDECNNGFHMFCLTPPMSELPDEDWYCPSCKRDPNDVVAPGAAKQTKKANQAKSKRDWGRGMACVGKSQTSALPANHFGPIPGVEVGMAWRFRIQLSESGVHRPPVSGIHGRDVEGAYSLVLSGGYEDDVDNGIEFTYTGSGGRDLSGNKRTADQSSDQTLTRENKALARNCAVKSVSETGADAGNDWREGRPVRVVRSYKMLKHFPQYAPKEGIRYDGIYKVVKYYPETGKSGFRVWKYLLRRDDPNPAPWDKEAKQYSIVYPDGYLEAEAEKKAQKEKGETVKSTKSKKRILKDSNHLSDAESTPKGKPDDTMSPPMKKRKTRSSVVVSPKEDTPTPKRRGRPPKNLNKSLTESPKSKSVTPFTIAAKTKSPKTGKSPAKSLEELLSPEELKAVRADTFNSKLWDDCLEVCRRRGKQQFISHLTQLFLCIICQEVATNPVTTGCHHNFCITCLKLAFKSTGSKSCSYCRQDLSRDELELNQPLQEALRTFMPGYDTKKK